MISSDGMLHVMGLQSGKDLQRPAPFVPANSRWSDPIAVGTMLYTSTSGGCGGAPDAVWGIDLESESKPVVSWKSDGPIIGSLAFTTDGTLVAATGRGAPGMADHRTSIVALDAKTLHLKDWFNSPSTGEELVTGPSIFRFGNREIVAAGTDGRIVLLDAASLGGATHAEVLMAAELRSAGGRAGSSLATWQDTLGTRWILAPTNEGVAGYRVVDQAGRTAGPQLAPGWHGQGLGAVETPIVVNGVVFVLSSGGTPAGGTSTPAVLHAYDGTTGKELWTSGKTMTEAGAPGSFWSAFGQVYVGTIDGTLYAFGFSDERSNR